jgi:hypothetical protein
MLAPTDARICINGSYDIENTPIQPASRAGEAEQEQDCHSSMLG